MIGFKEHLENEQITQVRPALLVPRRGQQRLAERIERGPASRPPVRPTSSTAAASRTTSASKRWRAGIDLVGGARSGTSSSATSSTGHDRPRRPDGAESRRSRRAGSSTPPAARSLLKRKLGLLEENGHASTRPGSGSPAGSTSRSGPTPTTRSSSAACPSAACAGSAPTTCAARATGSG